MISTKLLDVATAETFIPALVELITDAVHSGASLGFWQPLAQDSAVDYWRMIIEEIKQGQRQLLAAFSGDALVGSAQLAFSPRQNASRRVELQKLIVHTRWRGQGFGSVLLDAVEDVARTAERHLIFLDTRSGDPAEQVYLKHGYTCAGIIPHYIIEADGSYGDTAYYYKFV